ncbi:MAG TPA: hypothetical protein VG168_14520 [Bryobacteraceae bacterium]|nr:hypothetical protein [Bryobacteraceae bacterium]
MRLALLFSIASILLAKEPARLQSYLQSLSAPGHTIPNEEQQLQIAQEAQTSPPDIVQSALPLLKQAMTGGPWKTRDARGIAGECRASAA